MKCLKEKSTIQRELASPAGVTLQCRFEPIYDSLSREFSGATLLMEDLTTVRIRAEELTGIRQINDGLRAQNHEFLNKLHTISGLIQLEEYEEAIHYITGISHNRQEIIARLNDSIKDSSVAGLLLGKYNKAQEQKTAFLLEDRSFLPADSGLSDILNLILGNLIENSLEELADLPDSAIMVKIIWKDRTLQLQISDNGRGISDTERVFEKGFSSKGAGRGLGLYLIRKRIKREGGSISLHSEPGNTCFTIEIPQKNGEKQ
jgi:sensor histidine kinase regulating citrate/malate metabolism